MILGILLAVQSPGIYGKKGKKDALVPQDHPRKREPAQGRDSNLKFKIDSKKLWTKDRIKAAVPRDMYYDQDTKKGGIRNTSRALQEIIKDAEWTAGGAVLKAAGRVYFYMSGTAYVCSGTVATDSKSDRSLVITAAHCVYDDSSKKFAESAVFIPNQDDGGGDGTDEDCTNDLFGCWNMEFGVVDNNWATKSWPNNIVTDYAYYVVSDNGMHSGGADGNTIDQALDIAVGSLPIDFSAPVLGDYTYALGYSYRDDPNFHYCAMGLSTDSPLRRLSESNLKLDSCGLTGGSSGGPWIQDMDTSTGTGSIISVNSYGPTRGKTYMGASKLYSNSAECLFSVAKNYDLMNVVAGGGEIINDDSSGGCVAHVGFGQADGGGGGGTCAPCIATPSSNDQLCCNQFGDSYYFSGCRGRNCYCSLC